MTTRLFTTTILLTTASVAGADTKGSAEGIKFFESKIRPVLIEHCYKCHSAKSEDLQAELRVDLRAGLRQGGESGAPSVVPGKPSESVLLSALRHDDFEMPPDGKLPAHVVRDFEKWIRMGAPDPRDGTVRRANAMNREKARQFWSFRPIQRHAAPAVKDESWPADDVDRFILARLEEANLAPAPDASRDVLIRRLYVDLIGLLPTPEQIETFAGDSDPQAMENLVDLLLARPEFGERWGRHWLDVARFAETSGGGRSLVFNHAWRYRNYVIDSFNMDVPFDQFVAEQVAGDLLPYDNLKQRRRQLVATGFLALGPYNYELQDKELLMVEVVDEQIDTIGRAFLGMTIGCARCHDHKFDPIPTRDYYALAGILGSTKTTERSNVNNFIETPLPFVDPELEKQFRNQAARLEQSLKSLEARREQASQDVEALATSLGVKGSVKTPRKLASLDGVVVDDVDAQKIGRWKASTALRTHVHRGYVHDDRMDLGQKRVVFRPELPEAGKYEVRVAYSASSNRATNVPVEIVFAGGERTITLNQRESPPDDPVFYSLGTFAFEKGTAGYVSVSNAGTDGFVIADAVQFLPASRSVSKSPDSSYLVERARLQKKREKLAKLISEIKKQQKALKELQSQFDKAMTVREEADPGDWRLLVRGVVRNYGPTVPRGFLSVIESSGSMEIPDDESGRRQLVQWLTSPDNPLTARVIVNRVWHHLFGTGLVSTPDNFGTTGAKPSHPKLLDTLAADFMADGWSVKRLIRRLTTSRVYRMSGADNPHAARVDPENRLLWRRSRRPLDAEVLRDGVLQISGALDRTPGRYTLKGKEFGYQFTSKRRSVYLPVLRNTPNDLLAAFDFPNPNLVSGKRGDSTVPTQALFLMNSPFVLEQSRQAARRLLAIDGLDRKARLDRLYWQVVGRAPSEVERKSTLAYLETEPGDPVDAWAGVYQVLFSSIDFRYVR